MTTQLLSLLLRKLRQPRGERAAFLTNIRSSDSAKLVIACSSLDLLPLVIAEVICGLVQFDCFTLSPRSIHAQSFSILLGPTAMGRVPGFTEHIFPEESQSYLNLYALPLVSSKIIIVNHISLCRTATIGLVLFLFLVGLEIDIRVIRRNARDSLIISIGGNHLHPQCIGSFDPRLLFSNFTSIGNRLRHGSPHL
jgi:hypothetical protein